MFSEEKITDAVIKSRAQAKKRNMKLGPYNELEW
jgi:hypothetical protein